MFQALNHDVLRLRRIAIGPLTDDGMFPGMLRPLNTEEIEALFRSVKLMVPEGLRKELQRESKKEYRSTAVRRDRDGHRKQDSKPRIQRR